MVIRPHHLQCLKYYKGNGYSEDFVNNMDKVLSLLNIEENIVFKCKSDDICKCCPNRINEQCATQEKVIRYDYALLNRLNLKEGNVYKIRELLKIINNTNLLDICLDCEWRDLCLNIENNSKNNQR